MNCELQDKIFSIDEHGFESLALDVFRYQYRYNDLYRSFVDALPVNPESIHHLTNVPFLPVSFFKNHEVVTGNFSPEIVFESSGTTNTGNSRHLVKNVNIYRQSFSRAFSLFYGEVSGWCILGLLPSYLERQHSSLVMMVEELMRLSGHPSSGFYLYEQDKLASVIRENESRQQKTLLIGVTFALLDLAEKFSYPLKHTVVMETGGMKGRRKEMTRSEVHNLLKAAWSLPAIHSEYGMTELLSQAYSAGKGIFLCPPWMKVLLREEDDPLVIASAGGHSINGLVNIIDFANIYSCAFIATDDIGRLHPDGSFEVTGRMDGSDIRGCSLMYA